MEPSLRAYLETLRADSFVQVKPGYTDTAAVNTDPIAEVSATPEKPDKKSAGRRLLILPKKKSGT